MKSKDMMSRLRLMCVFAMTAYAVGNASAQSFTVTADDGAVVPAGQPHQMTVNDPDASYSGPKILNGWYTWDSPMGPASAESVAPQICAPNAGGTCLPTPGTCIVVTNSSPGTALPELSFTSGAAKFCLVAPEVGKFAISVNDASVPTAVASPMLRVRPHHFDLSGVLLKNRSELTCSGSSFTYMGEPIGVTFTLTAMNQAGVKTVNYAGSFVQFTNDITNDITTWTTQQANSIGLWMVATGYPVGTDTCKAIFSNETPSVTSFACTVPANNPASISRTAGPRVTIVSPPSALAPSMSWADGAGTFTANVVLERADVPDGPYDFVNPSDSVNIGIVPMDADGVTLLPGALNLDANNDETNERANLGSTKLRYGRFKIPNAYGSELLPLPIEVQAQYWARNAYVNNDDDCTPLAGGSFITAQAQGAVIGTGVAGAGTLTDGKGKIVLIKPSPKPVGKGAVDVSSQLSYLPGRGRATFGLYKGGPVIYFRELHF
jgi:MSHA biogenesis protein MshQ